MDFCGDSSNVKLSAGVTLTFFMSKGYSLVLVRVTERTVCLPIGIALPKSNRPGLIARDDSEADAIAEFGWLFEMPPQPNTSKQEATRATMKQDDLTSTGMRSSQRGIG